MNTSTQQVASNSEQSASAAEELSAQAERVRTLVGSFSLTAALMTPESQRLTPRRSARTSRDAAPTGARPEQRPARSAAGADRPDRRKRAAPTPRFGPEAVIPLDDDDDRTLRDF